MYVSKCCKAEVKVEVCWCPYYSCVKCGRSCDLSECPEIEKNHSLEEFLSGFSANVPVEDN